MGGLFDVVPVRTMAVLKQKGHGRWPPCYHEIKTKVV